MLVSLATLLLSLLFARALSQVFATTATVTAATLVILWHTTLSANRPPLARPLLSYVVLAIVSTLASANLAKSYDELVRICMFALVGTFAALVATHRPHSRLLVGMLGIGTATLGTIALVESLAMQARSELAFRPFYRWTGFWSGYPELALLSGVGSAILLGVAAGTRRLTFRIACLAVALPPVVFIAIAYARAEWIALALTFAWIVVVFARRSTRHWVLVWLGAVVLLFIAWIASARLVIPTENVPLVSVASFEVAAGARVEIWRHTLEMIRDNPLLGSGPGTYDEVLKASYLPNAIGFHAHNMLLHVTAETGIPAAICFFLVWWSALKHSYRRARRGDPLDLGIHFAVVMFFARSLLDQFLSGLPSSTRSGLLAFLLVGLAARAGADDDTPAEETMTGRV